MKILQISIEANANSIGKISELIGDMIIKDGGESFITYARDNLPSNSNLIKIGTKIDIYWHVLLTRLYDRHCLHSTRATHKLIQKINKINPDIVHLHHIHGYYLNMEVLFKYLKDAGKPVIWTFHDCWSFTGHCSHPTKYDCDKWKTGCEKCPGKKDYPASLLCDRSKKNWKLKNSIFNSVPNLVIVAASNWMQGMIEQSFLQKLPVYTIYNGIDVNLFKPVDNRAEVLSRYNLPDKSKIILGVASIWTKSKGLDDFFAIGRKLSEEFKIILVGLDNKQLKNLPKGIIGVKRTYDIYGLAELYSAADVFVNPTYADTFPTTNLEALACGTPVITYKTGGSPEAIDKETGIVVNQGDIVGILKGISEIINSWNHPETSLICRRRAVSQFDKAKNFHEYLNLYKTLKLNN